MINTLFLQAVSRLVKERIQTGCMNTLSATFTKWQDLPCILKIRLEFARFKGLCKTEPLLY